MVHGVLTKSRHRSRLAARGGDRHSPDLHALSNTQWARAHIIIDISRRPTDEGARGGVDKV